MRSPKTVHGFTLVEMLVVVAIIALLTTLLVPIVLGSQEAMDRAKTLELIQGLQQALKTERLAGKEYPFPDNLVPPVVGSPEERVGFFIYDISEKKPGLINTFMDGQGYSFDYSGMLNDDKIVTDAWGNPIHYVLGDYKNRKGTPTYDPALPQDLNKPKDGDKPAADSNWNTADEGKFPYVYSEGIDGDPENWIYYTNE